MRIVTLVAAYALIALFFGLLLMFPNHPASLAGFVALTCAMIPLVAVFDLLAQKIIDASALGSLRSVIAIITFAVFLFAGYQLVVFLDLPASSW
ncbi:MAG: hypothetical protein OEW58_06440 [Gammaproteobacteria bacterium]|nr:hypothetical protein [Gammaproteobacteria bacterium]